MAATCNCGTPLTFLLPFYNNILFIKKRIQYIYIYIYKHKLIATFKKFYGRHHDQVILYNVAVPRIVSDVFAIDE